MNTKEISEHHKADGSTTTLIGGIMPDRHYHYSLKIEDVNGMHDAVVTREEAKVLIDELTEFVTVGDKYPFEVASEITWTASDVGVATKRAMIKTGITHIRRRDAAGVMHIGLIESFDYSDEEWVFVIGITPPQSGRYQHEDMWDLVSVDIEVV